MFQMSWLYYNSFKFFKDFEIHEANKSTGRPIMRSYAQHLSKAYEETTEKVKLFGFGLHISYLCFLIVQFTHIQPLHISEHRQR